MNVVQDGFLLRSVSRKVSRSMLCFYEPSCGSYLKKLWSKSERSRATNCRGFVPLMSFHWKCRFSALCGVRTFSFSRGLPTTPKPMTPCVAYQFRNKRPGPWCKTCMSHDLLIVKETTLSTFWAKFLLGYMRSRCPCSRASSHSDGLNTSGVQPQVLKNEKRKTLKNKLKCGPNPFKTAN